VSKNDIFQFKFGKEKRNIFHYVKVGILLKGTIDTLSLIPFVDKKSLFNFIDKTQQSLGIDDINDYIIQDPEYLKYRVERTIDKSLKDYDKTSE
jgi:hypothetical protein